MRESMREKRRSTSAWVAGEQSGTVAAVAMAESVAVMGG
jgi:hypothetical protein